MERLNHICQYNPLSLWYIQSMKLLLLNSVCGTGSTGRICVDIAREYEQNGYDVKIAYGRNESSVPADARKYAVRIGTDLDVYAHVLYTRLTDKHGLASKSATRKFLKWADEYDPDILWIHNIHGYYINYELLFAWIKSRPQMQVKWTLHDCWAFTGHCSHYMASKCDQWEADGTDVHCDNCPQLRHYPTTLWLSNSQNNYERKRNAFTGVLDLKLITPSKWLAGEVWKSFLREYPVEVIYNEINSRIFHPRSIFEDGETEEITTSLRRRYSIPDNTHIVLAVSGVWDKTKGLDDILELDDRLRDRFQIDINGGVPYIQLVIVGLTPKQVITIRKSHPDILCIEHTNSVQELAEIYRSADVFINPTYEDNYPTVNLEAEACGTPVITYDTGGCTETIHLSESKAINQGVDYLVSAILDLFNNMG